LRSLRSRGAPFFCTRFAPLLPALTPPPPPYPLGTSWSRGTPTRATCGRRSAPRTSSGTA
jgi:hypothetical protein